MGRDDTSLSVILTPGCGVSAVRVTREVTRDLEDVRDEGEFAFFARSLEDVVPRNPEQRTDLEG